MSIDSGIKPFYFIVREDEALEGPIRIFDVVDLGGHRGDDSEIVTGALHGPP